PISPPFPYTTLFRSDLAAVRPTAIVAVIANGTVVAPRHTERNVHALIRPVVILVAVASQGNAHITNAAHIEIVGEHDVVVCLLLDRKSTRLNSSHVS